MFFFILLDEVQPVPVQVPYVKPDPERANPKIGVGQVAFSRDNRYLATKNGKFCEANGGNPWFLCQAKRYGVLSPGSPFSGKAWEIEEGRNREFTVSL